MKKKLWIPAAAVVTALVLTACFKNDDDVAQCTPNTLAQDQHVIDSFINENGYDYLTYNSTYYVYTGVTGAGTGSTPKADSLIAFKYSIRLMNGTTLGTSDTISTYGSQPLRLSDLQSTEPILYNAFQGIGESGSIRVIAPSSLYSYTSLIYGGGCKQQTSADGTIVIPAYSQL